MEDNQKFDVCISTTLLIISEEEKQEKRLMGKLLTDQISLRKKTFEAGLIQERARTGVNILNSLGNKFDVRKGKSS